MSTLSLLAPEQPEAPRLKFDWKIPVILLLIQIGTLLVSYGTIQAQISELFRVQSQQERHLEHIDDENKVRDGVAGEIKEFRTETSRRFDSLEKKIEKEH